MTRQEAERQIAAILKQFELVSGLLVDNVEINRIEVTRFKDTNSIHSRNVAIVCHRPPGNEWGTGRMSIDKDECVAILTDLVEKAGWYGSAIELHVGVYGDDLYDRAMKALGRKIAEPPIIPPRKERWQMSDDQIAAGLRAVGKAAAARPALELEQARERVRQLEAGQS